MTKDALHPLVTCTCKITQLFQVQVDTHVNYKALDICLCQG